MPALRAVLEGIAADGGLFVPERFPRLDGDALLRDARAGYANVAARVLAQYFDIDHDVLLTLAREAYAGFAAPEVVPLRKLPDNVHVMELFHGPTLAFKDMALQILPRLMRLGLDAFAGKEDALILTATSGDTGKAALAGFRDVARTSVFVFYPLDGVAEMQRLQMVTQEGGNVGVCAVKGNFDDAQTGVKRLFADKEFAAEAGRAGCFLSSANSINIGRLIPQVAYYCHAYAKLVGDGTIRCGDGVNAVVPTGNFGNILAAYYAKLMGLPLRKLVCASNRNNVLTDFFRRGTYDARREFHKTMSPSMDILVSSNLERLLFELCDRDSAVVRGWMDALRDAGSYAVPAAARERLAADFYADFCTDEETGAAIRSVHGESGYLMDPHTAVAEAVCRKYRRDTGDNAPAIVAATADPYKFAPDVWQSLTGEGVADAFIAADKLSKHTGILVPAGILDLKHLPERHTGFVEKGNLEDAVRSFFSKD
jgi:threonine synthase